MRYLSTLIVAMAILFSSGCQQSQNAEPKSKITTDQRKEKLLAAEIINLKAELDKNKIELDKQSKSLADLKQKYEQLTIKSAQDVNQLYITTTNYSNCYKDLATAKQQLEECQKMVDLTDVPALCKDKIEKQKKMLADCQKEKEEIEKSAGEAADFAMKQLPEQLMKQVEELTAENELLKAKIAELEKSSGTK
jgi:chromosome segregation ATPase